MELFLVRHALALPPQGEGEGADDERPLAPKGVRRFRQVVRGLKALGVSLDLILTSPKRRALETASLLAEGLGGEVRLTPHLLGPPGQALLEALPREGRVALVGHEPFLSALLVQLLLGDLLGASVEEAVSERLAFKKGGVAWLEGEARPGGLALKAFLPPKVFRV
ncbi:MULTISPECIES: SixA phosphatase family protein [Thermus]|jgi:phosphohistidine phosphatase|uniref:Histidine phosphatase superfamily (Branch 1) n=1 Tax=Thermus brockianus TaxID=56956 RepID=A0A1J0LY91_THEBO|nr:histidine phosphatase family protein [Thermus brockianus]APD10571.1 Histidine phosphatase superfamily (branch 1) [Thermus brockianus]BDG17520.1 phosphohistidine phosphatase [Thermus brockianus]